MEIGPITGIRIMPVTKTPAPPELSAVFDISLMRSNDDSYAGGNRRGTGGQDNENDEPDDLFMDDDEATAQQLLRNGTGGINIFA
jgi:hypothetical protein